MKFKEAILSWGPLRGRLFKSVISEKDPDIKVTDLSNINVEYVNIKDKYFNSCNFNGSSFNYCTFKRVRFCYSTFLDVNFYHCRFEDCSFEYSTCKYTTFKECDIQNSSFDKSRILFCIFRGSASTENTWKKAEIEDPLVRECNGFTFEGGRIFEREIKNFYTIEINQDLTSIFVLKDNKWLTPYGSEVSKENIIKRIEAELWVY